ncbi:MAG: hypothetical protein C5B44_04725 [Acidobacteria bacterium]|nr:MAG: hypothetical protein C5B44_04725 [Acidobacteriota bacterium]
MSRSFWFVLLFMLLVGKTALAQSCNPVSVNYIVRDEAGRMLSNDELTGVAAQLPKQIGDATTSVTDTSFAPDNKTYYWSDDAQWANGTKVSTLMFSNAAICAMHFSEITLHYKNKTMRLIFGIDLPRYQPDRRPVVDSLPFQNGTFRLDLNGWTHDKDKIIPATRWKRLRVGRGK